MKTEFYWSSPLGISAILFISIAIIYILIGALGLIITLKQGAGNTMGQLFLGKQVDELIFGKSTSQLVQDSPNFTRYISMLILVFCSFMVGMGILQFGVARFALIEAKWWAWWISLFSNAIMLGVYWFLIIIPVLQEYKVTYFSLWHPYAFIPTLLLPIALISGWIGLRN